MDVENPDLSALCPPSKSIEVNTQVGRPSSRVAKKNNNPIESALTDLIKIHMENRQEAQDRTAEDAFFESCSIRMRNLPPQSRSYLQLQISQLFFNAENPQLPPVQVTPKPPNPIASHPTPTYSNQDFYPNYQYTPGPTSSGSLIGKAMNIANDMYSKEY